MESDILIQAGESRRGSAVAVDSESSIDCGVLTRGSVVVLRAVFGIEEREVMCRVNGVESPPGSAAHLPQHAMETPG